MIYQCHYSMPPFHPLHATVMAISTLHGSEDPADLRSDLPEQEDLQTGPLELPKEQRILLAIKYYHETIGTPQAESTCQIATRFQISRTTLQERLEEGWTKSLGPSYSDWKASYQYRHQYSSSHTTESRAYCQRRQNACKPPTNQ